MDEKLLTTREVSRILGVSEQDVIELAQTQLLPHFKIAGEYIRFRRADILKLKQQIKKKYGMPRVRRRKMDRFREFFYFYDFYIACAGLIIVLLWVIFKDFRI